MMSEANYCNEKKNLLSEVLFKIIFSSSFETIFLSIIILINHNFFFPGEVPVKNKFHKPSANGCGTDLLKLKVMYVIYVLNFNFQYKVLHIFFFFVDQ